VRNALSIEELKHTYGYLAGRYDIQHALITAGADQRGRKLLIEKAVNRGDQILDCGSGTGRSGILAAKKTGPNGKVTLFDLSEDMLSVARKKVLEEKIQNIITFKTGDIVHLPFESNTFDVVISTYSLCPVYDPEKGALELFRVTKPGGRIAVAHSTVPRNPLLKWLADRVEDLAWHFPWLSMGCRSVHVLPVLEAAGGKIIFSKNIGIPLWPFFVFILEK
jgi:demethylmenaquinone methyltransferase/2-methoxy-6-polyprenyl-1,4-benzoquinol methylase